MATSLTSTRLLGRIALVIGLAALASGCVAYGPGGGPPPRGQHPSGAAGVPPGHMPPPGMCRIWYPDRPPGHQPPPGNCHDLQRRVPRGAILVRG